MDIITIEGAELASLLTGIEEHRSDNTVHTLRINPRPSGCAVKVNKGKWTPTIGSRTSDVLDALATLLDIRENCLSLSHAYNSHASNSVSPPASLAAQEYADLAKLLNAVYVALGGTK